MKQDWEARWRTGDIPWDKGAPAPALVEYLTRNRITGRVLVPGCGSGHDVRALSAQGNEVLGLDISQSAVDCAASQPAAGGEAYYCADLFDLPDMFHEAFDWVFEHTCFCAIPPDKRTAYVQAVHQALKPGGSLLGLFYIKVQNPSPDKPPYPVSPDELDDLFGDYFITQEAWIPNRSYESRPLGSEEMRLMQKRG